MLPLLRPRRRSALAHLRRQHRQHRRPPQRTPVRQLLHPHRRQHLALALALPRLLHHRVLVLLHLPPLLLALHRCPSPLVEGMIFWPRLELREERAVEVYAKSAIQRRKTGVRLLCLEALMSRHLELQAVAVLLKGAWQAHCKMHWQSESRKLAAVVSILFPCCLI